MRWLADECVDARIAAFLRSHGHDVIHVANFAPSVRDTEILQLASSEGRIVLTEDKDFGDLVVRHGISVPGVVLLRVDPDDLSLKCAQLLSTIEEIGETLLGRHVVIEAKRFRSRPLP